MPDCALCKGLHIVHEADCLITALGAPCSCQRPSCPVCQPWQAKAENMVSVTRDWDGTPMVDLGDGNVWQMKHYGEAFELAVMIQSALARHLQTQDQDTRRKVAEEVLRSTSQVGR
jgi:hypothetical protein